MLFGRRARKGEFLEKREKWRVCSLKFREFRADIVFRQIFCFFLVFLIGVGSTDVSSIVGDHRWDVTSKEHLDL